MKSKHFTWALPLFLLCACSNAEHNNGTAAISVDRSNESITQHDTTAISAAQAPLNSPMRKVVRTADFRCKVKDVFTTATTIEHMAVAMGGIVQESHIDNSGYDIHTTKYTGDSLRQTTRYTTTGTLTLRVPAPLLDSFMNSLPALSVFIDARTLRQNDVTFRYLGNELKNNAGSAAGTTARALSLARKTTDPLAVQDYTDNKENQRINRQLDNLAMAEDINYATVTIALAQPEMVLVQHVANTETLSATPFGTQLGVALRSGWGTIEALIITLTGCWPLLLAVAAGMLIFRRARTKRHLVAAGSR